MAKKTQAQLLEELIELVKPINNLTRYYIQNINANLAAQQANENAEIKEESSE